jgi:YihY family inner membrane protein
VRLVQRLIGILDATQQRFAPSAFVFGVIKKYGDDRAGTLSAVITFYGLLSVFPLLLLFVTIVGMVVGRNSHLQKVIIDSAIAQFPVIGSKLEENVHALSRGSPLAFVASFLFLLWGALGITNAVQLASARIWGVPRQREASTPLRILRGIELLGVIALSVLLSSVLAGASTFGATYFGADRFALRVLSLVAAAAINVTSYLLAFWILAPPGNPVRRLLPGTVVGGVGWTAVQAAGGYLIGHQVHRANELYGFFAIVLGLIFWLNLAAQLFLYASEVNVVHARHLWPRSLTEPPPTEQERWLPSGSAAGAAPGSGATAPVGAPVQDGERSEAGPRERTSSTCSNASRNSEIQAPSLRPTNRTHQARASLRLRATPASIRVSSTARSPMRRRVMTGMLAVVK